jgi:SAM-dependent methyltransferase
MTFKRKVLSALKKDELLAVARGLELDVTARSTVDELREALAASKRARLGLIVTEGLSRDVLKEICRACGLDDTGKEKRGLVERILAAGGAGAYQVAEDDDGASRAAEGAVAPSGAPAITWQPSPKAKPAAADEDAPAPGKTKGKKGAERRRAGVPESEAFVSGSLKAALRQFALGAAGGYRGRDGAVAFTTHLLECFGWAQGRPDGASIPYTFRVADAGQLTDREVALWWPERRTMVAVVPHDAVLDFAWKDLLRACLQHDPPPQYVVFTNQRDLQLYDLARDRDAARLGIAVDDLPKYSEAFPFFTTTWKPGDTPRIVNVEKVSAEVADLVARLYRSVRAQYPDRQAEVIRFTLQCITAMFAEDIGLLPKSYFTSLLYDGARNKNLDVRLHELFVQMNTKDLPSPRVVPYFNGGLFTDAASLTLGSEQIVALTKAAEANWTYVDPHIFGSVFQGIMDDAERHASGAHYTAHDDIMRVVGPTIVEPWRKRILAAGTLKELTDLRAELLRYRVLDPACGSGNFLYVAFRELYRLDTELLSRMREFRSTHGKLSWNGGIPATNFYGIDINPFAVELAKVTLNIAKKIAFEERRAAAYALAGQVELDLDPSLPLDNLDENIVCKDALFCDWPVVDAIVGNPPFLGEKWLRTRLGSSRVTALKTAFPAVSGDLCVYWFYRAHAHLRAGNRAGLVAPANIRFGVSRLSSLDHIVSHGGTIVNAVSERDWPGEAAVTVCMVNWVAGLVPGPHELVVGEERYLRDTIPTHLQLHCDASSAVHIEANRHGTCQGVTLGTQGFILDHAARTKLLADGAARPYVEAVANGEDVLNGTFESEPVYAVHLGLLASEDAARSAGAAYRHLECCVKRIVEEKAAKSATSHYKTWLRGWWRPLWHRRDFLAAVRSRQARMIACSRLASRPIFFFLATHGVLPLERLQLFQHADDYSFGILQSTWHWEWTRAKGGRLNESIQYSTDVWHTFPWPQEPSEQQTAEVAAASRRLRALRVALCDANNWSLRELHQSAEVQGPHPLKDAQAALDAAVRAAYGAPDDQNPVEFLLELNQLVAEDEAAGRKVRGPGLPDHLDPNDPRWMSTDCIEPPSAE